MEILQNTLLRVTILPELGASLGGFELRQGGFWWPVLRPTALAAWSGLQSPDTSCYPLAPYSNRIRQGQFSFDGQSYRLLPNWPGTSQPQHGEVHQQVWRVVSASDNHLECSLDAGVDPQLNFPFTFSTRLIYTLGPDFLEMHLALTNTDTRRMPAGMGFHPYFVRHLGLSGDALLQFGAGQIYLTDESCLPEKPAVPVTPPWDFGKVRTLHGMDLDHVYAHWAGEARLCWPGSGWSLKMQADPVFSHLVVFTAPDGSVALEPVSHATDGFNLLAQGWPNTGVRLLEPGETMAGKVRLQLVLDATC
jgi:aldose 1-epimerase